MLGVPEWVPNWCYPINWGPFGVHRTFWGLWLWFFLWCMIGAQIGVPPHCDHWIGVLVWGPLWSPPGVSAWDLLWSPFGISKPKLEPNLGHFGVRRNFWNCHDLLGFPGPWLVSKTWVPQRGPQLGSLIGCQIIVVPGWGPWLESPIGIPLGIPNWYLLWSLLVVPDWSSHIVVPDWILNWSPLLIGVLCGP